MLKNLRYFVIALVCLISTAVFAEDAFKLDKDYQLIPATKDATPSKNNNVKVIEFFSYGCPHCYKLESELGLWLLNKPKDVELVRVPVIFEPGWPELAKAFYISRKLGIEAKMDPLLFMAVQLQGTDLSNEQALQKFFVDSGVSKEDFTKAYHDPELEKQVKSGDELMRQYQIFAVPTFAVDSKYKANMALAGGDSKKLLKTLDFLIDKARKEKK